MKRALAVAWAAAALPSVWSCAGWCEMRYAPSHCQYADCAPCNFCLTGEALDDGTGPVCGAWPRILVLGAQKAATTSLAVALDNNDVRSPEKGECCSQAMSRVTHGALPHRAPSTRCTADAVHHVWHRR